MKRGFTLEDSVEFAKRLEAAGVDLLVLSGGFTSHTPFYLMRGDVPLKEMIRAERQWQHKGAFALFGRFIIGKYEFSENFFMPMAKQIRQAVKMPLAYLGGVVSSKGIEQVFSEGFDMVAIGRSLIHDPDFILKIKDHPGHVSECNHCNICVAEMDKNGVRCVLADPR
jgi:2,4-dienoyl-CoA reductase-like NADH-dependent reductase (Old Yellow Enzyme family)